MFAVVVLNPTILISPQIDAKSVPTLLNVCHVQVLIHGHVLPAALAISCLLILQTPSASHAQVSASPAVLLLYASMLLLLDTLYRLLVE
jgi:hypothetical protein